MDDFITFDRNILLCLSWIFNMIYSNRCYRWSTRHIVGCTIHWALSSCLYRARLAFFLKEHSFIRFRKWDSCLFQYLSSDVYIYIYWYLCIYRFHLFTTWMSLLFYTTSLNFFNFAISLLLWISVNFCNSFRYMTYLLLNPLLLASSKYLNRYVSCFLFCCILHLSTQLIISY